MAFVTLSNGSSGNLDQASYDYGLFNDIVLVRDGNTYRYDIETFEGNDVVYNTRTTSADTPQSFQQCWLGEGNDTLYGGGGRDASWDGSGNDLVLLGAGNDIAHLAAGNDTIDGGAGLGDELNFQSASIDRPGPGFNNSGVTVDLKTTTAQNFGIFGSDKITGFENVIGGAGSDRIFGTEGANVFQGQGGNNFFDARGGNDTIYAWGGMETVIGGLGSDQIYLGEASAKFRDVVRYNSITESGTTSATWDILNNFDSSLTTSHDVIDLSAIDGNFQVAGNQAFIWRGTGGLTSSPAGEVRLFVAGGDTYVWVDTDADVQAEMVLRITLNTTLKQSDFIL